MIFLYADLVCEEFTAFRLLDNSKELGDQLRFLKDYQRYLFVLILVLV